MVERYGFTFSAKGHGTENNGHSRILIIGHGVYNAPVGMWNDKRKIEECFYKVAGIDIGYRDE